jgi:transposase
LSEEHLLTLAELVARRPDATLEELRRQLRRETNVEASISTIWRGLERIEFTQKKTKLAQEADPVERAAFRKRQRRLNVWRLVFVDEFGINRAMSRIYARAPRGERARVKEPTERGSNISVISALRLSGVGATMMIEGAVDTQVWDVYIERFLVPELKPGEIVMLDQVSFHGSLRAIGLIRAAGARVEELPAYSPDFDPLEECISKIKGKLRSSRARTELGLLRALKRAIEKVMPKDIRGWFKHCGYTHLLD